MAGLVDSRPETHAVHTRAELLHDEQVRDAYLPNGIAGKLPDGVSVPVQLLEDFDEVFRIVLDF